jgi:chemotaxis protein CheZ
MNELRTACDRNVSLAEIADIVESVLKGLESEVSGSGVDIGVVGELEALSEAIKSARSELSALSPEDIRNEHIPAATNELDAIVLATEVATNSIMEVAEDIEKISEDLPPEAQEKLNDAVVRIFESCSFQDITGQRITKVVQTLKIIESEVDGVLSAFGDDVARERKKNLDAELDSSSERADEQILHGPQSEGEASSQDDIDKLLASFD